MKTKPPTQRELHGALYRRAGKTNRDIETQVLNSILDFLGIIGVRAFRRNVGMAQYVNRQGKVRFVRFNQAGQSDIWAVGPFGAHIEIEVKQPGEEPTAEQHAWLDTMRQKGSIAFWADSLESCVAQLRDEYQKREWAWRPSWNL